MDLIRPTPRMPLAALLRPAGAALLVALTSCSDPQQELAHERTPENIERALAPQDNTPRFESESELLAFVFPKEKPDGYRGYRAEIPRSERPILPAELDEPVRLVVDADAVTGSYPPIHDEVNVWKLYALFHPRNRWAERFGDGFLNRMAPWWVWARIPAALGGNYTPEAAPACDARLHDAIHDIDPSWECGTEAGAPGIAAQFEPVRVGPDGELRTDFGPLREALLQVVRAGLYPHLNLSSAPSVYTGAQTAMKWYHWNEEPVRDLAGWSAYVESALQALNNPTLPLWRFSIVNEPNCLRAEGPKIFKVGYRGGPEEYARQYVTTAAAIRKVLPGMRFQVGNYVVSDLMPEEKNLHLYLAALRDEFARNPGLAWNDATFYSVSIYDVPHKSIYGADAEKFGQFQRFRESVGLSELPLKIDEYDIHPDVFQPYDREHSEPFYTTWHSASWLAKAFKVFRENGVRSAAGWASQVFYRPGGGRLWEATPRYFVYLMDALLAGRVRVVGQGPTTPQLVRLEPGKADPAFEQLKVYGGLEPAYRGEGYSYRSVEATATRDPRGKTFRILLFHHTTVLDSDEATASDPRPAQVELRVTDLPFGEYEITLWGVGPGLKELGSNDAWIRWDSDQKRSSPWNPVHRSRALVSAGSKALTILPNANGGAFPLPRHSVLFVEIRALP